MHVNSNAGLFETHIQRLYKVLLGPWNIDFPRCLCSSLPDHEKQNGTADSISEKDRILREKEAELKRMQAELEKIQSQMQQKVQ